MKINKAEWKWHGLMLVMTAVFIFPVLFAVSNSCKTMADAFAHTVSLIPHPFTWDNYRYVWEDMPFLKIVANTFWIAAAVTAFKTLTGFLAAYAFTYYEFRGKNLLYFLMIGTLFIPFTVVMIPNYLTISSMGLLDHSLGVILPQLSDALGIFLMRQAMRTIPPSLVEVMKLNRVSDWSMMKDLVFPLIRPAVVSSGIIFFINAWNEYVWPMLILKSREGYTLPLALQTFISSEGGTDFTIAMAVSVLSMLPPLLLYLLFQKLIISTFSASGIKG